MSPTTKATYATSFFAILALWSILFSAPVTPLLWPHVIFYAVLLVNTFFSVRFYAAIQPDDGENALVDVFLVVTYIALALLLGRPFGFAMVAIFFWIFAVAKYALMLNKIPHTALLRKKILIDSVGTFSAAALLAATLAGYGLLGAWILAILFGIANLYVLIVNPMYKL